MSDDLLYWDRAPARYAFYLWERALAWWESQKSRVQEDYDAAQGYDSYMQDKQAAGYSNIVPPLIYVVTEARAATMWELLSRQEPFFRCEPIDDDDVFSRVAAERQENALQGLRTDLNWNERILDLMYACEWSDHAWLCIEPESLRISPEHGLLVEPSLYGTEKDYMTFNVYSPGQVIMDGFHQHESQVPAKFKLTFMTFQEMKQKYPEYVTPELRQHAKPRNDSAFYNPNDRMETGEQESAYYMFNADGSSQRGDGRGFLVAEAHIYAVFSDNQCRRVIYTFLPEVRTGTSQSIDAQYGYPLCPPEGVPHPYESVDDLNLIATARKLPYTMTGRGTSGLLVPLQREFADAISSERDLDRQYLQPDMAIRAEFLIGTEDPHRGPGQTYLFRDTDWSRQNKLGINDMIAMLNTSTPNRGYLQGTREKLQNLVELVGAAMEASTGAQSGRDEKVGIFQARARGSAGRVSLVFSRHAGTLTRATRAVFSIMAELEQQLLYPHISTRSKTFGQKSALTSGDIMTPTRWRIPALEEYANREMAQMLWMSLGEVLTQNQTFAASPEANLLLVEDIIRSKNVSESRVEQYKQAVQNGIMMANAQAMMQSLAPQIEMGAPNGAKSPKLAQLASANQMGVA